MINKMSNYRKERRDWNYKMEAWRKKNSNTYETLDPKSPNKTYPVIVSDELSLEENEKLLNY
jgi:hypothetical protein